LFGFGRDEVIGLDIGSSAVKLVQLHKNNSGYFVTAAGISNIAGVWENNNGHTEKNTIAAIQRCVESACVRTRLTVCGVSGPETSLRHFKFPAMPNDEVRGAVRFEAEQVCPFDISDSSVDYELLPDSDNNTTGILVAATNKLIKGKKQLVEDALLCNVLTDMDGLALLNCFEQTGGFEADQTTAILNVGNSCTTLAIVTSGRLPFVRDIAYGGADIIKQMAAKRTLHPEAVSKILSGCENPDETQLKEINDDLQEASHRLAADITESLRYYTTQEKSAVIEKIFVCGGFALVKGFTEILNTQLAVGTVLWNPFDKIPCLAGPECENILRESGPAMAVAAGLAMRSI